MKRPVTKKTTKVNRISYLLLFICVGLVLFGTLMIYNASSFEAYREFSNKFYYVANQLVWAVIGLIALAVCSLFPYKNFKRFAVPLLVINSLLLLIVLIPGVGTKIMGARRWLNLGIFSFQPSELLKLSFSIYLAAWLEEKRPLLPYIVINAILLGLIIVQPDLGTGIIIITMSLLVYFLSGADITRLFAITSLALLAALTAIFSSEYRRNRIITFLNPSTDPLGKSYHVRQILIALGSGGIFGVGLGQSRQKYQFLPEATTDSIFAVIAEETGFLGAVGLIIVYLLFLYLGLKIALRAPDRFGRLLAASLTVWVGAQIGINLAAMVSLVPLTGIPLPFISYGGSSLVVAMASVGILINISRASQANK